MSTIYSYEVHKKNVFTEEGQVLFLKIRDRAKNLLKTSGAFREGELLNGNGISGDSWLQLACVDRLVELGEIVRLRDPETCWRQYQVYSSPEVHNR
jgi:hypothetical protein